MIIDIKAAADFYGIDNAEYVASLVQSAKQISADAAIKSEFEKLYTILYIDVPYSYDTLWSYKLENKMPLHFAAVLILSAYKLHIANMQNSGFDAEQQTIQKNEVKHICCDDVLMQGRQEVRFTKAVWSARFIWCKVLCIGRLQFECEDRKNQGFIDDNKSCVLIHIPPNKPLAPQSVDESLCAARPIIDKSFGNGLNMYCKSWLLSDDLYNFLPPQSNIMRFKNRFEILRNVENTAEFLEFTVDSARESSFSKAVKEYVENGGVLHIGVGKLK